MVFQWEPIRAQVRITGEVEMQDAETTMVLFNRYEFLTLLWSGFSPEG